MTDQEKQENEQDELLREMYPVALQLKLEGKDKSQIKQLLVKKGLDHQSAKTIVDMLIDDNASPPKDIIKDSARREMIIGVFIAIAGIVISFLSYQAAVNSPEGGTYVLAWGVVVFGIAMFVRGLAKH